MCFSSHFCYGYLIVYMLDMQDKGLRELSATALSSLVKFEPENFANVILEKLVPCTLSSDLCMRHGATLAIGEVVLALHKHNYAISTGQYAGYLLQSALSLSLSLSHY